MTLHLVLLALDVYFAIRSYKKVEHEMSMGFSFFAGVQVNSIVDALAK